MILKRLIPILLAVPLLAACPSGNPNGKMPVDVSKLPRQIYSGEQGPFHVQGIAVDLDRGYMYFSFTTTLLKTDMQGNLLGSVEGMTGHLGCMTLNPDDGRLYASIEYKHDAIGKGILNKLEGVRNDEQTGFYVAVFDVDRIDRIGTPEKIFAGNYVQELYGVADQSFDPVTGQIFLCTGHQNTRDFKDSDIENCSSKDFCSGSQVPDPVSSQIFVIGGAGSGIPVYNRLWRENIPFAAGILQENDVEYKAAVALASEVVSEKAFYPVGQDKVQEAKRLIDSCKKCICAVEEFGPLNEANRELAEYARRIGKTGKNI